MSAETLKNAKDTATELSMHPSQITRLMKAGAITPEVYEGRLIRYDVEKVRKQLAKRRKTNLKAESWPTGMVPTY